MTNKERYKRAFSALRPSLQISLEVEEMARIQKKHRTNMAVAAVIICAVILGGSGTVYAADIGGIRQKLSLWIHGKETDVTVTDNGGIGYTFTYMEDGAVQEMGAGGVSIGDDGSETRLGAEELAEDMNQHAQVEDDENGRTLVYCYDQVIDITDHFNGEGICWVVLTSQDGKESWLTVKPNGDGGYHLTQRNDPETDADLYIRAEDLME